MRGRMVLFLLGALLLPLTAATAVPNGPPITQSFWVTVPPQVVDDPVTEELVELAGALHVVTQTWPGDPVIPVDPMRIAVHLNGLLYGVGEESGEGYLALVDTLQSPPNPISPGGTVELEFSYLLAPNGPPQQPDGPPQIPNGPPTVPLLPGLLSFSLDAEGLVDADSFVVQIGDPAVF